MTVRIIDFPHPTLRHKSKPVRRVDRELRQITRQMFDLMYEANGVGLAANQVDLPFRLFVMNLAAKPDEGEEHVFINPVVSRPRRTDEQEEGCLSLAGVYGDVKRPERVHLNAYNLDGDELSADLDGFFARVVQHETDHLDGILFIDRLSTGGAMEVETDLAKFISDFTEYRERGQIESDEQIATQLREWEAKYC